MGACVRACMHAARDCSWDVAFAPDGETYCSGADDGTIRIWQVVCVCVCVCVSSIMRETCPYLSHPKMCCTRACCNAFAYAHVLWLLTSHTLVLLHPPPPSLSLIGADGSHSKEGVADSRVREGMANPLPRPLVCAAKAKTNSVADMEGRWWRGN